MDRINLFEIKIFLSVAKYKNFSRAANALYIAQPTVTKWIKNLETELEIKLFDRTSRNVELTPAGEFLYNKWSRLYEEFIISKSEALEIAGSAPSTIHIAALSDHNFDKYLSPYITDFETEHSNIKLDLNIYPLLEMQEQLHTFDIIFTINFEAVGLKGYECIPLDSIPFFLAVSKKHPLAHKKSVSIHDIEHENHLIFPPELSIGGTQYANKAFHSVGINPQFEFVQNTPSMLMKIAQNKGVAIIGKPMIKGYENDISLIHVKDFPLEMYRVMAYHKGTLCDAGKTFCKYIKTGLMH